MVEQCGGQWNTNSGTVMVEQCGGTVWWTVEQWNTNSGTVWWNSGTVTVEWNGVVKQCGGTIEQSLWNSGTLVVEQCNETVEQ